MTNPIAILFLTEASEEVLILDTVGSSIVQTEPQTWQVLDYRGEPIAAFHRVIFWQYVFGTEETDQTAVEAKETLH